MATAKRVTETQLVEIRALLSTDTTLRRIAKDMGLHPTTVQKHAKPMIAAMKAAGTLGKCTCGGDRFHPYCGEKLSGISSSDGKRQAKIEEIKAEIMAGETYASLGRRYNMTRSALQKYTRYMTLAERKHRLELQQLRLDKIEAERLAKRAAIKAAILSGETYASIAERWSMNPKTPHKYLAHLTPAERQRRLTLQATRSSKRDAEPTRPAYADSTYRKIADAVPRWLSPALRDDVISDMYVALLEDRLTERDIAAEAKRFANRAVQQWESRFGPRSLDELIFEDGNETFLDRLADPSALEVMDDVLERAWA